MKKLSIIVCLLAFSALQVSAQAPRHVVLEDYTGTWCGYCPDGTTIMNNLVSNYPNIIGVANHNSDPMANSYTNAIDAGLNINAYPNGTIDRYKFPTETTMGISRGKWTSYCVQRLNVTSVCNVGIVSNYNSSTRKVDVTVNVSFVGNYTATTGADIRLSVVLVENGVLMPSSPQKNYMGQGCSSPNPSSAWYTSPCNISNFVHDHTARVNLAPDNWGDNSVIPASVTAGQSFSKQYSYTLPTAWNDSKMQVLAFVTNHHPTNQFFRTILNANKTPNLNSAVTIEENQESALVSSHSVIPNPVSDLAAIVFQLNRADKVKVNVYNALGQYVATLADRHLTPGQHVFYWDALNEVDGLYFYEISSTESVITGKILVNH